MSTTFNSGSSPQDCPRCTPEKEAVKHKFTGITQNLLKIIAAISMLADHTGMLIFPQVPLLRIVGRIAFPIFAYSIYEGCKYTKNKGKYFLRVFILGTICVVGYLIFSKELYLNALISFSMAIGIIFALQYLEKNIKAHGRTPSKIFLSLLLTAGAFSVAILTCRFAQVDYGFWGIMLPVFAYITDLPLHLGIKQNFFAEKLFPCMGFTAALLLLSFSMKGNQFWSFFSVPLIFITGKNRGRLNMKYFFYIFYPTHLMLLEGISLLINRFR